jgi:hypothetical protein
VTHALRRTLLALALLLAASACGGDDGCAGFISINATQEQCAALAAQYGCSSFEVEGPSCGLKACATCTDL